MKMTEKESLDFDSAEGTCFLTKLEIDLKEIFDNLSLKYDAQRIDVKKILKKGSIFHKGDFFLCLRSECVFLNSTLQDELLCKLRDIPYIHESEIDPDGNLILCLKRKILFKAILKDVVKHGSKYGMKTTEKTFLILVHNEVFKNFDSLRIALIADHLISFLVATGAKVLVNEYRKDADIPFKSVPTYSCTEQCLEQINLLSELIRKSAADSKWASITETDNILIDCKKFLETSSSPPGKDCDILMIDRNASNVTVNQGAYTLHFQCCHLNERPDSIIHICSHSQRRKMIDSGILIEMLELIDIPQYFITCQSAIFKTEHEATIDTFMHYQQKEIETAMIHKFGSCVLKQEIWESHLKTLLNTAIKFYFCRVGTNVPMKIEFSLNHPQIKNKDGIFIQYNFARLSNLLKNFEKKVMEGYYKPLPSIDEVDFGHLKFEEEWNLLNFVLTFPKLVQEMFSSISSKQIFPVNKISIMLTKLCSCYSVYYSRIHILGGQQPQLQNVMHTRLWLLKAIHQIMYNSFTLLNIEGLNKM